MRRLALLIAGFALAAGADRICAAGGPEPGAIERTIPGQHRDEIAPTQVRVPAHQVTVSAAKNSPFTLGAVNIDGATIFSQEQLSRYFEPYLATQVDQQKLSSIADAITARYRETGYLLSYAAVPAQQVDAGMVRLAVVEGRIDKISIVGGGSAEAALEAIAAPLLSGAPLKGQTLERTLGLIRDFPGLSVTDIALMRSDSEGEHYTLKISMVPHRLRGFSYADNRGVAGLGRTRVYNSVSMSSLLMKGDEFKLDLFAMPGGHSRYLYGQFLGSVPIGNNGLRLSISGSRGNQYLRSDEKFDGRSDNLSALLSYPIRRSRALTIIGKGSLTDWRSTGRQGDVRRLRDHLRVARLGLQFVNEGSTRFDGEVMVSRGLGFGGITRVGDPLASRPDASGRFTKVALSAQVSRPLSARVTVRAVALAQYSDRPLLSAEEFSLGGNHVGRAYDFNAATGDRGAAAGLELGYRLGKNGQSATELFGFVDDGIARDIKSAVSPGSTRKLASTGAGARFSLLGTTVAVEAAVPLSAGKRARLFVSVFRSF